MSTRFTYLSLLTSTLFLGLTNYSLAVPTQVSSIDTPACDTLFIPTDVDEIGDFNVFPADESLSAVDLGQTPLVPCPQTNQPTLPEFVVDIRNTSGRAWQEVWYVADKETTITNFDGEANDIAFPPLQEAFRIDNDVSDPGGAHHPLIFESMTLDGIWEIGESWQFILQDYTNALGLPPSAITSIGVGDASIPIAGFVDSSGSIIGIPAVVPEPTGLVLVCLGLTGILAAHRRRGCNL